MARPPSRSGLTPAEALAAARAAAEARNPGDLSVAVAVRASEGIIAARERAAAWGKRLLRSIWTPVDPYDGDQVAEFAATAARHMATAQKTTATAAAAGQIQLLSSMGVRVTVRPDVPVDVRAPGATFDDGRVELDHSATRVRYRDQDPVDLDAAGMTTVEVFNRPARTVRYLESKGATREQAEAEALKRLDALVDGNIMLAQRLAESQVINAAASLRGSTVVGMRRIIHPELSRTGTCGLCIAASDRLYTVRELLPIHANCKCTSAPVTEEFDPADELNAVDLRQLYRDAGGTSAAHLKRTRYKEDVHGELGPVVIPVRKYKPRSKASEKAAGGTAVMAEETQVEIARRQLPLFEDNLAKLREQGLSEESSQIKYHKQQIERYRERLADQPESGPTRGSGPVRSRIAVKTESKRPETAGGRRGGNDDGGNGNSGGRGISAGDGDGDDPKKALSAVRSAARDAEPEATKLVHAIADSSGGTVERLDSRFKTDKSILEKLERFKRKRSPYYRLDKFNDALRYTVVLPESGYWQATRDVVGEIGQAGFTVDFDPGGWRANYRGLNLTIKDPEGRQFEVQLHTAASLQASEQSHGLYEEMRKLPHGNRRRAELQAQIDAIYALVPWPDGVPHV